jgi:SAM-dependent methyltransferase
VSVDDADSRQRAHYDKIAAGYEAHYSDRWSLRYRDRFINAPLTRGVDLHGRRVLDAMCGSGELTDYLLRHGAEVTGLDISPAVIQLFRDKHPQAKGVAGSIYETGFEPEAFDVVGVIGGLHHAQPNLQLAVDEIHRVLRPGGWFVFAEPHAGSAMDALRRFWYRFDPLFEANEKAVDVDALEAANRGRFEFVSKRFAGSVAYLLVFNSMVFRVPHRLKNLYSPALVAAEALLQPLLRRGTACMAVVQWRKPA